MEQDVTRYLPGMNRLRYQGLIYFAKTMRNLQTLLIKIYRLSNLKLRCLQINMWTWMVCIFPSLLRLKSTANATNIDGNMITLSNFFVHWIREIEVKDMGMIYRLYLVQQSTFTDIQTVC